MASGDGIMCPLVGTCRHMQQRGAAPKTVRLLQLTTTRAMDEVQADCERLMGAELGAIFATLDRHLIELHIVWQQYRQLFGSEPDTVALLNRTAGLFFKIVQDQIWDVVLLGISTITDPAELRDKKNLTVFSLPPLFNDLVLKRELKNLCQDALHEAAFAREHRNKRIAHHDHCYFIDVNASPLSGISRERVEAMLAAIASIMNRINLHFRDSTTLYKDFIDHSGASLLVSKLRRFERGAKEQGC